ncbi:MAG: IS607 family transposase [Burkholderiaceae bacterium]|jgi:excisionase family DNA binding protein|nr:IS607 family transposase [Burkholderiaceae bacterium]
MNRLVSISEAARTLGVSITTLRRWEANGQLPAVYTAGGHRRYDLAKLKPDMFLAQNGAARRTVAYACVSGPEYVKELERLKLALESHCTEQGWTFEVVTDIGSGISCRKKGLKYLLHAIVEEQVERLVLTHKDRLLRLGAELIFAVCAIKKVEVLILNREEVTAIEESLTVDVREIIAEFNARLYGSQSHKNQKLLEGMRQAVELA